MTSDATERKAAEKDAKEAKKERKEAERRRKKQEQEETRKRRAEEKQEEKEREAQLTRRRKEFQSLCSKAIARIGPPRAKLELALKSEGVKQMPKHVVAEANQALARLTKLDRDAKDMMHGDSAPPFTSEELEESVHAATGALQVLTDFLKTISKHAGVTFA